MGRNALNLVLYQTGWFACVLGAAWQRPWVGLGIAAVCVAAHVALVVDRAAEVRLIAAAALLGAGLDLALIHLDVLGFSAGVVVEGAPPPWMTGLWAGFATTLHFSLGWLAGRYLLAAGLGAVAGPVAFLAGERLGAVVFPASTAFSLVCLAAAWAAALPALVVLADRVAPREAAYRTG